MSAQTIAALLRDVVDDLGLNRPSTFIGNTSDPIARKLLRCLRRTLTAIGEMPFQEFRREHTFEATGTAIQPVGALATDFGSFIASSNEAPTFWNRTAQQPMIGPMMPGEWQSLQAQAVAQVQNSFYIRNGRIYVSPTPASGVDFYYEYLTRYTVDDGAGASSEVIPSTDGKYPIFHDDEAIILGTMYRYQMSEGLPYAETMREYNARLYARLNNRDGPNRTLSMGSEPARRLPKPYPQDYTVS